MKIIDLTPDLENSYFSCLEEWSDDIKEAGNHKACWYGKMKDKGLRVKLAVDNTGVPGGMIQYLPVEYSSVEGKDLYFVLCIWVHGHKEGIGNFQKKGMGKALLKAAEEDVRNLGRKGLICWGIIFPFFMRVGWFKNQGYKTVDKYGIMRLLWKPFTEDAISPKFIRKQKDPVKVPGKVNVSVFNSGWCPVQNTAYERTLRAIEDFKDKVVLQEYKTVDRDVLKEWGISEAIFVNGKEIRTGPPPGYKKIRKIIEKQVLKLK